MSIVAYYAYLDEKFSEIPSELVKLLKNPGAVCTIDRRMFINPRNSTFTLEEVKEIITYAEALKKKADEHKSSN